MKKQGKEMKKHTNNTRGEVNIGDITHIRLSNIDLSKVDCKILTLIVVEKKEYMIAHPSY